MPVHDWARVEAGIFHHFHTEWLTAISNALNNGLLPDGYYALTEQHAGTYIADVLTLQAPASPGQEASAPRGGVAVAEIAPRMQRHLTLSLRGRRRSLAIRHISGHRLVALLEIASPANKDRLNHVNEFVDKALDALEFGIHLLVLDLFPPGPHDPVGLPGGICQSCEATESTESYELPAGQPLTLAAFVAGPQVDIHLQHLDVGAALPEMPLFLCRERYVNVPLEPTYQAAYRGVPTFWRDVIEGRSSG